MTKKAETRLYEIAFNPRAAALAVRLFSRADSYQLLFAARRAYDLACRRPVVLPLP